MKDWMALIILVLFLNLTVASLQCFYYGIRYWKNPRILRPQPIILLPLGCALAFASIALLRYLTA